MSNTLETLRTQLEKSSNAINQPTATPWSGDWNATNEFLPFEAELYNTNGEQLIYPNMGLINVSTTRGDVKGFKKSSEQLYGLSMLPEIQRDAKKLASINNSLQKMAVLADRFMNEVPGYDSKFDESVTLYYQDGYIHMPNGEKIECQFILATKPQMRLEPNGTYKEVLNISFKIEKRSITKEAVPAPEMNTSAKSIYERMLG